MGAGGGMAGMIARGDVRLYRFARPDKETPVVVLTRSDLIDVLSSVTVAPVTRTIRDVPSEVHLTEADGMKTTCVINLHNVVTISKAQLGRRVAGLSPEKMEEVCRAMGFALGCI